MKNSFTNKADIEGRERDTPSRGEVGGVKNSSTNKADIEGKANFSDTAVLLPQTSRKKAYDH